MDEVFAILLRTLIVAIGNAETFHLTFNFKHLGATNRKFVSGTAEDKKNYNADTFSKLREIFLPVWNMTMKVKQVTGIL